MYDDSRSTSFASDAFDSHRFPAISRNSCCHDFDAHEMGEVVVFKGLSAIDLDVLEVAGLAGDGEGDGATADGAIFDTGVVALGGIYRGGKEFTAPRAGDVSFD